MRILVLFDLPVESPIQRREYARFRKHLIKSGFIMMQESVYSKLTLNQTVTASVIAEVKRNKPQEGVVQLLTVTEKQYQSMEYIVGEKSGNIIDNTKRLVII